MSDRVRAGPEVERLVDGRAGRVPPDWERHEERLTAPLPWWASTVGGAALLGLVGAVVLDGSTLQLVGVPLLLATMAALGLAYAGWVQVVVEDGVLRTRPSTFTFDVDDIVAVEVVSGAAVRQERRDHALTNRAHVPPWIHIALVVVARLPDGRHREGVVGTRQLYELLGALTHNRTDHVLPVVADEVRTEARETSPMMQLARQHNARGAEGRSEER